MKGKVVSFLHDPLFKPIADALDVEMKKGTKDGLGRCKQADVITTDAETELWEKIREKCRKKREIYVVRMRTSRGRT